MDFDSALEAVIADDLGIEFGQAGRLLAIPGIYEVLSEYYNNDVLDRIRDEAETDEDGEDDEDE